MSQQTMQEKFKQFGEALSKGTATEQLQAAENALLELAEIFSKIYPDINPLAITLILAEFERIKEGNSPQFLLPQSKDAGGKYLPLKNMRAACIVAAIDILRKNGRKLEDALNFVSFGVGLTPVQLRELRKKFYSRNRWPEAKEFFYVQLREEHKDQAAVIGHVMTLLQMAENEEKAKEELENEKAPDNELSGVQ
ncbi:MAG: hypothetical protein L7U52_00315 [Alphaproteobacteria bacterium]|nr:hypothetical protein [Alphaproteobacteria bacterium]